MNADDDIIYTSATSKDELEYRLQVSIDSVSNWYNNNKLCFNKKKSSSMVIGSKCHLKSFNPDDFTISVDFGKLFLARQAKYLGLWLKKTIQTGMVIFSNCVQNVLLFHMFRPLRKNLPDALLVNKSYVQSEIHSVLSIWAVLHKLCLLNRVHARDNYTNNFDYIHSHGIDLVRSLKPQTIRERRDYLLCV